MARASRPSQAAISGLAGADVHMADLNGNEMQCMQLLRADCAACNRQGGARAVDLPARSFDLARPDVVPPLLF